MKALIEYNKTSTWKSFVGCYEFIAVLIFIIGFIVGSQNDDEGFRLGWYWCFYVLNSKEDYNSYLIRYSNGEWGVDGDWETTYSWDLSFAFLYIAIFCWVILLLLPLFIDIFNKTRSSITEITLNNNKLLGSCGLTIKKDISIPIANIDNIEICYTQTNKFFSGKTILVTSGNNILKFPYVQNSEEFVSATLEAIKEYKKNHATQSLPNLTTSNQLPINNPVTSSIPSVLSQYKQLLDAGIITQEEFEAKKKQILNL